jgi:hypothetical protein
MEESPIGMCSPSEEVKKSGSQELQNRTVAFSLEGYSFFVSHAIEDFFDGPVGIFTS